jgi:AraC family transcriptional regulator
VSRSRHLASPADVMAALTDAVEDPAALTLDLRAWPELQLVRMTFRGAGACVVAPIAFHAVSTFTGRASILSEESDGYRRPLRLPARATLIRTAGTGARYAWTAPHRASMTCLDPQLLRRAAEETDLANPVGVEIGNSFETRDRVCEHLVLALVAEAEHPAHAAQPLLIQSIASALAIRLLTGHTTSGTRSARPLGGLGPGALGRVRAYIEETVGRPISLDDLAGVAGVSRFHFARQFRRSTGESAMGYELRLRIERGKARLKDRDATVSRIATELGFADQSHFTRTFRRFVGTTPTRFAGRRDDDTGG